MQLPLSNVKSMKHTFSVDILSSSVLLVDGVNDHWKNTYMKSSIAIKDCISFETEDLFFFLTACLLDYFSVF